MADEQPLYLPLNFATGEIRLLTVKLLEPGDNGETLPGLEVTIHHAPLNDVDGKYLALSYTWGKSTPTKTILLNGPKIQIRQNLYDFLLRYRECMTDQRDGRPLFESVELSDYYKMFMKMKDLVNSEMGEPTFSPNMPLWIDALCIDQSKVVELNVSVPRMKDVYEKAWHVIVWLGNATETSDEAMDVLQKARMKFGEDRMVSMFSGQLQFGGGRGSADSTRLGPAPDLEDWKAVKDLFEHPYWSRMWVVQEVAFTFRYASIWCGRRQMHAHSLAKVQRAYFDNELGDTGVRDYTHPRYDAAKNVPVSLIHGGPWPIEIIRDLSDKPHGLAVSGARSTREMMSVIRARKSSLPHDMIYALYRLIVPGPENGLIVDYGRTVAQVYCDYMEYEVNMSKSWQIWQLLTEKRSEVEDLPSWAIAPGGQQLNIQNFGSLRVPSTLLPQSPDAVNAGGSTTAIWRIVEPNKSIAVTGFIIGKIDAGGGQYKCVQSPEDENEQFWEDIDDVISILRESSLSAIQKVLRIGACLLLDDNLAWHSAENPTHTKFVDDRLYAIALAVHSASPSFQQHYRDAINSILSSCFDPTKVDNLPSKPPEQIMEDFEQRTFIPKLKQMFWDRTWIRNAEFDALGVAPAAARQGDVLFVPRGCPFVMALRPETDGSFSVVGPCWMYGFMHGGAVKLNAEGRIEEKEVVLV
ncbi:Heterokaryon incompatibility protein 6, OR allele [Cercospora zeina]